MIDKKILEEEAKRQNRLEPVEVTPEEINAMLAQNADMDDEQKSAMVTQMLQNKRRQKLAQLLGE